MARFGQAVSVRRLAGRVEIRAAHPERAVAGGPPCAFSTVAMIFARRGREGREKPCLRQQRFTGTAGPAAITLRGTGGRARKARHARPNRRGIVGGEKGEAGRHLRRGGFPPLSTDQGGGGDTQSMHLQAPRRRGQGVKTGVRTRKAGLILPFRSLVQSRSPRI